MTIFGRRRRRARSGAIGGMVIALNALNYGILQSIGRTQTLFRYTLFASLAAIASFVVGLRWGMEGVAASYALVSLLVLEPGSLIIIARAVGVPVVDWIRSVGGVFEAGAGMAVIVAAARVGLLEAALPAGARLAVLVAVGICTYLPLLRWRAPELLEEVKAVWRRPPA